MKGKVYIVGAGVGGLELLTLKAMEVLKKADVILYDELISDDVKEFIKTLNVELINVGKRAGMHRKEQEEINELLVKLARQGKTVVRLKGGDPFVFGRGGEEVEYLAENGIQFEVIPGISSAIAVPAIAGIPITHRDYDPAIVIMTGREKKKRLNWEALAKLNATIVILMGVKTLRENCEKLLKYGKDPNTPVAIIEKGFTNEQRVITGKLAEIADIAERENVNPPAVIVIGEVVKLREKIKDFLKIKYYQ